jgi:D-arabinose 1-dehydrogenase-like Zn-dependent alcohol dehydrogenase
MFVFRAPGVGSSIFKERADGVRTLHRCQHHQVHLCESLAALGLMADGGLAELCVAPAAMCLRVPPSLPADKDGPRRPRLRW